MWKFLTDTKAFWKSYVTLLAISAIWYGLEFIEFGTLCWDRKCDNVIGSLFFIALWYANHQNNYWTEKYVSLLIRQKEENKFDNEKGNGGEINEN